MKRRFFYLPELLVLLLCAVLLIGRVDQKQGYHMDELLSFELSNAMFNPWIVPTQPQGRLAKYVENEIAADSFGEVCGNLTDTVADVLKNGRDSKLLSYKADVYEEPVWIERETFADYITVGKGDAFSYLSVYFNVKDDNHPPLHFMLLHTVSSLFPGRISPWMGCGINLIFVLGTMALLMWLGRVLMKLYGSPELGRIVSLGAAALYGLSAGAVATTLLIRMYAMVTFFCVASLAVHVKRLAGRSEKKDATNALLILITVLGFWTQYFFLFYCLILAAVTAIVLFVQKRKKELWQYIRSMVTAAVIGVALFPFAISDVFCSGRGVEALENLSSGIAGLSARIILFLEIVSSRTGVTFLALLFGVINLVWFGLRRRKKAADSWSSCRGLTAVLWAPIVGYFFLAARMSPYLVDRYVMPLFPLVALVAAVELAQFLKEVCKTRGTAQTISAQLVVGTVLTILAAVQLVSGVRFPGEYLYQGYEVQEKLAKEYRDHPCIGVYDGVSYYENLPEFTEYESTLLITCPELEKRVDSGSIVTLSDVVVLVKHGVDRDRVRDTLEGKYGLVVENVLFEEGEPYHDTVWFMKQKERR